MRHFVQVKVAAVATAMTLIFSIPAHSATILLGLTGDGGSPSETLFELSKTDASETFFMTLGNGADGETIGYNPVDGLLYHASGISDGDRFWESINVNTKTIATSQQFLGPNVDDEQLAMVYNPATGRFLVTDRDDEFFDVTLGGSATDIGDVEDNLKGLAFVGNTLYGAEVFDDELHTLNPLNGLTLTTVNVTMPGFTVEGMNGLATDPDTGILWSIVKTDFSGCCGRRHLATIDPATGVATRIGGLSTGFAGIAFVRTAMSVPEPGTIAVLGFGLAGLAAARRRKAAA